jgi:hypothetical protein
MFLGGYISSWRSFRDPEGWFILLGLLPYIGVFIITPRVYQKLSQLQKEMKKQGVTDLKDFKPLPSKDPILAKIMQEKMYKEGKY